MRKIRKRKNLTQSDLAKLIDPPVTQGAVAQWEKSNSLNMETIRKIAKALDCHLHDIFYEEVDLDKMKDAYLDNLRSIKEIDNEIESASMDDLSATALMQARSEYEEENRRIIFDLQMFSNVPEEADTAVLDPFHQLNDLGKQIAIERVQELTEIPRYKKEK